MCVTCGCGNTEGATLAMHDAPHDHVHADGTRHVHAHAHAHAHAHVAEFAAVPFRQAIPVESREAALSVPGRDAHTIQLETQILGKNQLIAERNRDRLAARNILALNLMSSPGAGKTTLLERTLRELKLDMPISVIEGDQATSNDAERIRATGTPAVQINTGRGCHIEADMVSRALDALDPTPASVLMIENVGNLVCPALFDLGERAKVVIFSVTEGEDKPLKYPHMFSAADVLLLSKIDLLPHIRFDADRAVANALSVNPRLTVFRLSAYSGEGLAHWYGWLKCELAARVDVPQ